MLRQTRIWAFRSSPAQKWPGLRVTLFQELFKGNIFCFLGDSFGQYIFELYARKTNLKKKAQCQRVLAQPKHIDSEDCGNGGVEYLGEFQYKLKWKKN
jgi:hypothetical protein